jgi:GTP cyclohydrolase II
MTKVIPLVPVAERELSVQYVDSSDLPTPWALFRLHGFLDRAGGREHVALTLGEVAGAEPVLARVHSECLTGDAFFSRRCDCGAQLEAAMKCIAAKGRGVLVYLRQEGRGIGLLNKIRAYRLQDEGMDTVEANQHLGFGEDERRYDAVKPILEHLGVETVHLMTNNPRKVAALEALGIQVASRRPLVAGTNPHNHRYLRAKARRLGHWIPL